MVEIFIIVSLLLVFGPVVLFFITRRHKGRWLASDVDDYIESLSNVKTVNAKPTNDTAKRRERTAYEQRQKSVAAASERLGLGKAKGKQESQ